MSSDNKTSDSSGLPDIAAYESRRKIIVLILLGLICLIFLGTRYFSKSSPKNATQIEETYTVVNEAPVIHKPIAQPEASAVNKTPDVTPEQIQQQLSYVQEKQRELQQRLAAPLMIINGAQSNNLALSNQPGTNIKQDPNMQFMDQISGQNSTTTYAKSLGPLQYLVAEGHLIHAVLESATDSDLPGFLRAAVSMPVYAEDGSQILIPENSRLIGQYKSGMMEGQSRIFIVWTRLIIPGGISIHLGSSGVDNLGVSGVGADEVNRHFWQRFGTASLLSMLGAGAANVGVNGDMQDNSVSAYRSAIANSFSQSASQSLQHESMIAPTLKTHQGKPIMVFVARDLNFQSVMKNNTKNKMTVF